MMSGAQTHTQRGGRSAPANSLFVREVGWAREGLMQFLLFRRLYKQYTPDTGSVKEKRCVMSGSGIPVCTVYRCSFRICAVCPERRRSARVGEPEARCPRSHAATQPGRGRTQWENALYGPLHHSPLLIGCKPTGSCPSVPAPPSSARVLPAAACAGTRS